MKLASFSGKGGCTNYYSTWHFCMSANSYISRMTYMKLHCISIISIGKYGTTQRNLVLVSQSDCTCAVFNRHEIVNLE